MPCALYGAAPAARLRVRDTGSNRAEDFPGNKAASIRCLRLGLGKGAALLLFAFCLHACSGEFLRLERVASDKTPLHLAVRSRQTARVTRLLAGGANPDAYDDQGRTPLHEAVDAGAADMVAQLLAAGANPNAMPPGTVRLSTQP